MCGGSKPSSPPPKENPAAAVAPASAPSVRGDGGSIRTRVDSVGSAASGRMTQRSGRNPYRVALDVSVANVGGSGATGLNIPKSG